MRGLVEGIEGLLQGQNRAASVKWNEISRSMEPIRADDGQDRCRLKTVRPHLDKKEPCEIAGTTYTPEKLQILVRKLL